MGENQWYTNKELYEKLNSLATNVTDLRGELRETRIIIKQYNGLREQIKEVEKDNAVISEQIQSMIYHSQGQGTTWKRIREWGGWLFGLVTLLVLMYNQLFGL